VLQHYVQQHASWQHDDERKEPISLSSPDKKERWREREQDNSSGSVQVREEQHVSSDIGGRMSVKPSADLYINLGQRIPRHNVFGNSCKQPSCADK